jgi:hypothetical protein
MRGIVVVLAVTAMTAWTVTLWTAAGDLLVG